MDTPRDTRTPQKGQSNDTRSEMRKARRQELKLAQLNDNAQIRQLLQYYDLSLTEPMPAPLFGADQSLTLSIYNDQQERVQQEVRPTLDFLSQDLGFAESAGYEAIKQLGLQLGVEEVWLKRLRHDALKAGKGELQRYLRDLRPLLMKREIYFYCTSVDTLKTDIATGKYLSGEGKRPLCALPMSVEAAQVYGCSPERIKELALQVAWLIPMLVAYRQVKLTKDLKDRLDGWRAILSPQENERMHTKFIKNAPSLVTEEITRLLIPKKPDIRKK